MRLGAFVVGPALLAAGRPGGPLSGLRFAVKDLFDVAGTRTGAGNPEWLADAPVADEHCPAVRALLAAGADLWGKTVSDELAFSLSGSNVHYGTPPNPRAPGRVPGGSSSGSASAVAGGAVDFALGTDTGGSVRVPASYCGLFGLRPTHGLVSTERVVPLAPSFDTVGVLSRHAPVLAGATRALLAGAAGPWPSEGAGPPAPRGEPAERDRAGGHERRLGRLVLATDLLALADDASAKALTGAARALAAGLGFSLQEAPLGEAGDDVRWRDAYRAVQLYEAWQAHGSWISERRPSFGPGVASRFAAAARASRRDAESARLVCEEVTSALSGLLSRDALLVQPAAAGPAHPAQLGAEERDELRSRTLSLTAPAGLAGAPVVSLPLAEVGGLPVGLALVGLPGDDEALVALAERAEGLVPAPT